MIHDLLKSITTKQKERECDEGDNNESTTPIVKESRIPERGFRNPLHESGFRECHARILSLG
ncbi:hypothetical protein ACSBR2_025274 [Camellia fascicularis]